MSKKLRFLINKLLNYTIIEISLADRWGLFLNHIRNLFKKNRQTVSRRQLSLEKIFVISLSFRKDRRSKIQAQLNNIPYKYSFIDGVVWNKLSIVEKRIFKKRTINNLTDGALGCAAAHLKVLELISQENKDALFLILEDDTILSEAITTKMKYIQENYPCDADIFYLGTKNVRKRDISYFIDDFTFKCFNPRIGMYAYLITPLSAKKILSKIIPLDLVYGGLDTKIGKLVRRNKLIAYQIYPSIVSVDFSFSSNIYNPSDKNKKLHPSTIKK